MQALQIDNSERQPLLATSRSVKSYYLKGNNVHLVEESCLGIAVLSGIMVMGLFLGFYLLIVEGRGWELSNIPYNFVSRTGWQARTPRVLTPLQSPISDLLFTTTNTTECSNSDDCERLLRKIQRQHMNVFNYTDIAYNFLVTSDGVIYEGRGWEAQNPFDNSNTTLALAFVGTFQDELPPETQLQETQLLINELIQWRQLQNCYTIVMDGALFNVKTAERIAEWFRNEKSPYCQNQISNA